MVATPRYGGEQWATTGVDGGADGASAMPSPVVRRCGGGNICRGSGRRRAGNDESGRRGHVGVCSVVGTRWFREHGGMPPHVFRRCRPYLSFVEREEIALLRAQDAGSARSSVGWAGRRRRSRVSCGAMPPLGVAGSSTGPRTPSGMQTGGEASEDLEAGRQRAAAQLRAGSAGRPGQASRRHPAARPGRCVDRPSAWAAQGPPLGHVVESGADRAPLAGRLSR